MPWMPSHAPRHRPVLEGSVLDSLSGWASSAAYHVALYLLVAEGLNPMNPYTHLPIMVKQPRLRHAPNDDLCGNNTSRIAATKGVR